MALVGEGGRRGGRRGKGGREGKGGEQKEGRGERGELNQHSNTKIQIKWHL